MKEATAIWRKTSVMNRDEGSYRLSHIYDPVFVVFVKPETDGQGRRILMKATAVVKTVKGK